MRLSQIYQIFYPVSYPGFHPVLVLEFEPVGEKMRSGRRAACDRELALTQEKLPSQPSFGTYHTAHSSSTPPVSGRGQAGVSEP